MDAELKERVLECLRGLEIGESISADGIADEIGQKLSDVYDALEDLENAKLVEMHPSCRKGSDPTYTLTPKGKRLAHIESIEPPEPEGDPESTCQYCGTVMASPARKRNHEPVCGKNPNRNQPTAESIRNHYEKPPVTEPRASADRVCRFCKKEMEPNKVRRHERFCKDNPDRDMPGRAPKEQAVPAPAEYAEAESNATATLEHDVELLFVPNPDHCTGCLDYNRADGTCMVNCVTQESCDHAYRPREPQLQDVPSVEEILGQQQAAEDPDLPDEVPPLEEVARIAKCDMLVLKGSPGMDAAMRLIALCQQMAGSGAQVSVDATVQVSDGFHIHVDLCVPVPTGESDE